MAETSKDLDTYLRSDELTIGNQSLQLRTSQVTVPPGAEWHLPTWTFTGHIVVSVLTGSDVIFTRLRKDAGELWIGLKNPNVNEDSRNSHNWAQLSPVPDEHPVAEGDAVMFTDNLTHGIKNRGTTDAVLLVLSAVKDDQCGGKPCFTYP